MLLCGWWVVGQCLLECWQVYASRWVWGGRSYLWDEQGLVSLGRGQPPHLLPSVHCPLHAVPHTLTTYLLCVRGPCKSWVHCSRGHWDYVGDMWAKGPGRAAQAPESPVSQLASVLLPPTGTRWVQHQYGASMLHGATSLPSPCRLCLGSRVTCRSDPSQCLVMHTAPLERTAEHRKARTRVSCACVCEHRGVYSGVGVCNHVDVQAQEGMYTHMECLRVGEAWVMS